jgi:hypothetical protein
MLLIITFRSEGVRHADGHIGDEDSDRVFCGKTIPGPVIECGLKDPKNPYVGKSTATCIGCISEFNNGRRVGFREET